MTPWSPTLTIERKVTVIICRACTLTLHQAFWWVEAYQKQNCEARGAKADNIMHDVWSEALQMVLESTLD